MVDKSTRLKVNTHHPTGTAEVSISVWLDEDEREGLLNRVFSRQTLLHDRERVLEALQLVDDNARSNNLTGGGSSQSRSWEVTLE